MNEQISRTSGTATTSARMVVILLGGPGAGKGTQAEAISGLFGIPHISTGQLLRSEAAAGTVLGLRAKALIDAGRLVDDEVVNELVAERIRRHDCSRGFILDGYPRDIHQAVAFGHRLAPNDRQVVIDIVVELEKILPRLTGRRTCPNCGAIFHAVTMPPRHAGCCDHCSHTLTQRPDDHEGVIRERFRAYHEITEPLTDYYQRVGHYHRVDGMRPPPEIAADIRRLLEARFSTENS